MPYLISCRELLKDTNLFPCFDPHYYQCSRTTTSKEVEVVFQRALKRQEAVSKHQYDNFQNSKFPYLSLLYSIGEVKQFNTYIMI